MASTDAPQIALIGTEGSGKTVLTATLAKKLSMNKQGVFLEPIGPRTIQYVEQVWHILQNSDWPPSTPPGELFDLGWRFHLGSGVRSDMRLIDAAGQDFRALFQEESIHKADPIYGNLGTLADYCRSADIAIFLVNLAEFMNETAGERQIMHQATIKAAMDFFRENQRTSRMCIVLTQTDLYREWADENGGFLELAHQVIPYVFSTHVTLYETAVFPISAVANTRVTTTTEGRPIRVPEKNFSSLGIDEVVSWIAKHTREIIRESKQVRRPPPMPRQRRNPAPNPPRRAERQPPRPPPPPPPARTHAAEQPQDFVNPQPPAVSRDVGYEQPGPRSNQGPLDQVLDTTSKIALATLRGCGIALGLFILMIIVLAFIGALMG